MNIAFAPLPRRNIKLQIGVPSGDLADALQRRFRKRCTSQVRMQNNSGGIDDSLEGKFKRAA